MALDKWPADSAFHPENVGPVSVIMLQRIYDLLAVIAYDANPDGAQRVIEAHRAGQLLSPPPSFATPLSETDKASDSDE